MGSQQLTNILMVQGRHRGEDRRGGIHLTRLSIMVSMLACPRCSELPSAWLSSRFFMMAMVCSTNCVLVSLIGTCNSIETNPLNQS